MLWSRCFRRPSKQDVIGCVASGRLHHLTSAGSPVPTPVLLIGTTRMVAGQSVSAARDEKEKNGERSCANISMTKPRAGTKKAINLLRGWPSASLLPADALCAASQTALTDPKIWAPGLEYAPDPGYQPLRKALARWLGRFYGDVIPAASVDASRVDSGGGESSRERDSRRKQGQKQGGNAKEENENEVDRITITGGASQSLACLLQSFTDPARTLAVWVVAPCYFLACPIFADAGFAGRMRAVPEDEEGVDTAILEREMRALEEATQQQRKRHREEDGDGNGVKGRKEYKDPGLYRKIYRHVIYCVPAFSNPSGRTMTLARREALVDLARRRDALVICDDVYDMLQWRVESPPSTSSSSPSLQDYNLHKALLPRVVDIDIARGRSPHDSPGKQFGHVVSNGSFSKLVAPGTRTGWTYSTPDFALGNSQTGSTRSGGAASQLAATIVCELLLLRGAAEGGDSGERKDDDDEMEEDGGGECQLDTHIRGILLPSYARRHALLMRAVRTELVPLGVRVHEGSLRGHDGVYGGYFVWMTLPTPPTAANTSTTATTATATATEREGRVWPMARAIADRCRADEALLIGNGELFAVHGDEDAARFDNTIRLCFAWEGEDDLVEGVERLGRVIRKMLDEGPESWKTNSRGLGDVDQAK
ncbi:pyridoxal phosphate-dependent transferase [Xylaria longipes]|nr:pyridoxal phosphate-dependent transferase [Xylaria longipes]